MIHGYSSTDSFADIAREFDSAAEWLAALGVPAPPGGRHQAYGKLLHGLAEAHAAGATRAFIERNGLPLVLNAALEGAELRRIHRSLNDLDSDGLSERLRKFVKGPAHAAAEKPGASSNTPRDIAFELSVGARLRHVGVDVDFTEDADLRAKFADAVLYFECKRPQSHHQVHARIKGAQKQLVARLDSNENTVPSFGILCLSITKIEGTTDLVLQARSQSVASRAFDGLFQTFISRYRRKWKSPRDPRIVAVLLEVSGLVELTGENRYSMQNFFALVPIGDHAVVERLADKLSSISPSTHAA